ncbi:MAG: carboxypeptidase-like regulatory domain-containing protein, partial [Ginsengibacter sp.]
MKTFSFLIAIIAFSFFSISANAQKKSNRFTFSGEITDTSGAALAGASVYIPDLRKGSIADGNGNYQVTNVPAGSYLVEIKYIGYKTIAENIDFDQNKTENFSMEISVVEESAIVVTGSSRATS